MRKNMWVCLSDFGSSCITLYFLDTIISMKTLFFFTAKWNSILYMNHIFITHVFVHGYLGWFHFLATINTSIYSNKYRYSSISMEGDGVEYLG